jgi:hypothetical protein
MLKRHLAIGPHGNACGRVGNHTTTNVYNVTCLNCQKNSQFIEAKRISDEAKQERFDAQIPRRISEPWRDGNIVCECGNDTFRIGDRSCYGHYDNYHCGECGKVSSRLTETGMSF